MPEADVFEAPPGRAFHGALTQAISEALVGNGIQNDGDAEVTADTNTDMGVDVAAATDLRYGSTSYSPAASSFTLTDGPTTTTNGEDDRRVDAVVFDSSTPGYAVVEGTADPNPEPPSLTADQLLLALVYIDHGVTNVDDTDILNWRAHAAVDFPVVTGEIQDEAVTLPKIDTDISVEQFRNRDSQIAGPFTLGTNPGDFGALIDAAIDGNSAQGTAHTYALSLDGSAFLRIYAESDGADGFQNPVVRLFETVEAQDIIDRSTGDVVYDSSDQTVPPERRSDLGTVDLTAEDGATTVYDQTNSWVPRPQVEDRRKTTAVSSNYTTSDDEVIFVDTSAGAITVTLASADADAGKGVTIIDDAGNAEANPITVATEGAETIDTVTSKTIDDDFAALNIRSNGSNWFTESGTAAGDVNPDEFSTDESGTVAAGDSGVAFVVGLPAGKTFNVYQASLLLADGQAAPTDLDLIIATLDNAGAATVQTTIIAGDGTVQDNEQGEPLASYENTGASSETVALLIDNGNFNAGTGASQDVVTGSRGAIE